MGRAVALRVANSYNRSPTVSTAKRYMSCAHVLYFCDTKASHFLHDL